MSDTKKFIYSGILAIFTLVVPILFASSKVYSVLLMFLISLAMCLLKPSKSYLVVFFVAFIFGTIAEMIAIYYGLWSYNFNFLNGVPIYLPFAWGNAGLYIISVYDFVKQYEN